jgi:triphosphoribosyl-dephospho-CoA synthetase
MRQGDRGKRLYPAVPEAIIESWRFPATDFGVLQQLQGLSHTLGLLKIKHG